MKKKLLKLFLVVPSLLMWQGVNGQYCSGGPSSLIDSNVESVNITGDNATSIAYLGCPGLAGVEDQTALSVDLTAGSIYTLDVEFGTCGGNYTGAGEAWIDFNQNGIFEASESIGTSSGLPNTSPWNAPVNFSFSVDPTAVGGATRMRVIQQEGGVLPLNPCASFFYGSVVDFSVNITAVVPTCPFPSNLVVSGINSTGATLDWTENGTATTWNVEWGTPGFTPGTGNELIADNGNTTQTSTTTGLSANSSYDVYVQADCGGGDVSFWIGPFSFSNSYCNFTITSTAPQHITSFITTGAIVDINNAASGPGTPNAGYTDFTTISMEAYETQIIDFDLVGSLTSTYGVDIYVDWNNNFVFDANENIYSSGGYIAVPLAGTFTIPTGTPVGQYRMRVVADYFNGGSACSGNSAEAEDYTINIINPPSCLPPMDVDTLSTTTTSVELEWTSLSGATNWIIEYGLSGFTQGSGMEVNATTNPFTVTGLTPSANYDFYVRSDCGGGDSSAWRGPFSTYTACGIAVASYYESFGNGIQPQCWENFTNSSTSVNNLWRFNGAPGYGAAPALNGRPDGTYAWTDGSFGNDSTMLVTPEIDISQLTTPYLSFEWFSNNTVIPLDNNPMIIEVFDGTSWNLLDTLSGDSPEWEFVNYDLSAYSSNIIKVRFMVNHSVAGTSFNNDILLDEIRIDDCISLGGVDGVFD
ncbi:fibronectin type III domain-containing protein, partial [Brumimicrobium mesophilum]|uniref:fibronectin type III domain-containing protein n=1 Tax=Brumimicrobium mesophilum TaxID=392717 RepID=UPI0018FE7C74